MRITASQSNSLEIHANSQDGNIKKRTVRERIATRITELKSTRLHISLAVSDETGVRKCFSRLTHGGHNHRLGQEFGKIANEGVEFQREMELC